jgi:hypothetical protein
MRGSAMSFKQSTSRPLGVAENLLGRKVDPRSAYSHYVVLTGEVAALSTANGQACFIDALMLLARVVGNVVICVPSELQDLYARVSAMCANTWSIGPLRVVRDVSRSVLMNSKAIISVGSRTRADLPWTAIGSNGWVARVGSDSQHLSDDFSQDNPIAALMAASLGVTEAFKRVFGLPHRVAPPMALSEFSLYELSISPSGVGPALPAEIEIPDTLFLGGGAIGNGNALLLSQLRVRGRIHVVDKQVFAEENQGTCVLMERSGWIGHSKAVRLATWLNRPGSLLASGEQNTIESALSGTDIGALNIELVLNGLDDPAPRCTSQRLWPSVVVDGGISEVGAAVTQWRLTNPELACMQCWFEAVTGDEKALQSSWTGLPAGLLNDLSRALTEDDILAADSKKRIWLQERKGKAVCSVITEAQLASRLGVEADEGFRPSVPFVATAASSLVIAEAIKALMFPNAPSVAQFQLGNLFLGPDASVSLIRKPSPACTCRVHRHAIEAIGSARRARSIQARNKVCGTTS